MARFLGIDIPDNKNINIGLTYVYGIGRSLSEKLLKEAGINFDKKVKDLTPAEFNTLKDLLDKKEIKTEGDLKREVRANIKRLVNTGSYRGSRHIKRLPVRGQRTKTNSRTIRGNVRKSVGSGRRKAASPT